MHHVDLETIDVKLDALWFYVLDLENSHRETVSTLGSSHLTGSTDGLGDADYWAFRFPCGMRLLIEHFLDWRHGGVFADVPEPDHAIRHLPFPPSICLTVPRERLEPDQRALIEMHSATVPALTALSDFQIWRQGDDGNKMKIGNATTERDARCRVTQFESHGYKHKQIYWYDRVMPVHETR